MDEYQNRRDIDKIYDDLYDQINGSLNVLTFMENSPYKNVASKSDGSDRGTIDAIIDYYRLVDTVNKNELLDLIYPIGAIFFDATDRDTCPIQILLGGVWEQIEDRFLLASGSEYDVGDTDGESEVELTVDEMPSHTHEQEPHNHTQQSHSHNYRHYQADGSTTNYSTSWTNQKTSTASTDSATPVINDATAINKDTGGGQAHNNMPPYIVVNVWKRIG